MDRKGEALMKLAPHQVEVVDSLERYIASGKRIILASIPAGFGVTPIICELVLKELKRDRSVFLAFSSRVFLEQFAHMIKGRCEGEDLPFDEKRLGMMTIPQAEREGIDPDEYNLVIINAAERLPPDSPLLPHKATALGFSSGQSTFHNPSSPFQNADAVFRFEPNRYLALGYSAETSKHPLSVEICVNIFQSLGYSYSQVDTESFSMGQDGKAFHPDLLVRNKHSAEPKIICEVKCYNSISPLRENIENAFSSLIRLGGIHNIASRAELLLIVFAQLTEDQLLQAERLDIKVWDIHSLIYFGNRDKSIADGIAKVVPFSTNGLEAKRPNYQPWAKESKRRELGESRPFSEENSYEKGESIIKRLRECSEESSEWKAFERCCAEALEYAFDSEFAKRKYQVRTRDGHFVMDMVCSLKGSTRFWDLLVNRYNSVFVVFEFKKYRGQVSQNNIYVTEKYLFDSALRNVAIIVSPHGFDDSARFAAEGCLKEKGKLIIDMSTETLASLIRMKQNGDEPSDLLLDSLEDYLMSISK